MDLKAAVVVVCLCAALITSTQAGIPKCCIRTKMNIPIGLLRRVQRWDMQHTSGACDIPALLLYFKSRKTPLCADPSIKGRIINILKRIRKNQAESSF